jgi:hypothetical protein
MHHVHILSIGMKMVRQNRNITHLEEQCHNPNNAHFELCPQEVCLRPYLLSGIASQVYFLKWPRQGRSVLVFLMRLHRPGQWFFFSPGKLYISSCDGVLLGVRYVGNYVLMSSIQWALDLRTQFVPEGWS